MHFYTKYAYLSFLHMGFLTLTYNLIVKEIDNLHYITKRVS